MCRERAKNKQSTGRAERGRKVTEVVVRTRVGGGEKKIGEKKYEANKKQQNNRQTIPVVTDVWERRILRGENLCLGGARAAGRPDRRSSNKGSEKKSKR